MDQTLRQLCDVTTKGLNQEIYLNPIQDEKDFYFKALENGLIGIIYHALKKENVSDTLSKHLTKDFYAYIASDVKYHQAIKKLNSLLNEHGIDHIFLKGSKLKNIYPESYMRAMGDIDILVHPQDMKKVSQLFENNDILLKMKSEQHDLFMMHQEITIEIHPKLYKDFNPKYEELLSKPWEYSTLLEEHEYTLNRSYELLYLLYHLAKHLDSSGIGLRSMIDIAIYVAHYQNEINIDELKLLLSKTDLSTFFTNMIYLNSYLFDFKGFERFYFTDLLSNDRYDEIANYLVKSGIHGKGKDFNPFQARLSSHQLKNKSNLSFFLELIFPTFQSMKGMYPILEKYKTLLPFSWVYRWFDLFVRKGRSTFKRLFKLKMKKQEILETKSIFKDLGL
jgi:predicted nucleotidyltransferase